MNPLEQARSVMLLDRWRRLLAIGEPRSGLVLVDSAELEKLRRDSTAFIEHDPIESPRLVPVCPRCDGEHASGEPCREG